MKFSRPTNARVINKHRVLCALLKHNNLSKIEISRLLGINKVSIGEIAEALINQNLLVKNQKRITTNGRRPTNLNLNRDYKYVLACEIDNNKITYGIVNIKGEIKRYQRMPFKGLPNVEYIATEIIKFYRKNLTVDNTINISICISANIENNIISKPCWNWDSVNLCEVIEKYTEVETIANTKLECQTHSFYFTSGISYPLYYIALDREISGAIMYKGKSLTLVNDLCTNIMEGYFDSNQDIKEFECKNTNKIKEFKNEIYALIGSINKYNNINKYYIGGELGVLFQESIEDNIFINPLLEKGSIIGAATICLDNKIFQQSLIRELYNEGVNNE